MNKKFLSLLLALVLVVGTVVPAFAEDNKVVEEVTINVEVDVNQRGVTEPKENFVVPVSNKLSEEEVKNTVEAKVKELVKFDQLSEYKEGSVKLSPAWVQGEKNATTATFEVSRKPMFRLIYSNRVTNRNEHLKDIYMNSGLTREQILTRIQSEIRDIKFEDGFEFESFQILGDNPVFVAVQDMEYQVYVYAKQKASGTTPGTTPGTKVNLDEELVKIYNAVNIAEGTDGKAVISLPVIPTGLALNLTVKDQAMGSTLSTSVIEGYKEVRVPVLGAEGKYSLTMSLTNKSTNEKSKELVANKELKLSTTAPKLNYAYVINGRVVLNITSPVGLNSKDPIIWRLKGDTDFKAIDDFFGYGQDFSYDSKWGWDSTWADNLFKSKKVYDPYERLDKNDYAIDVEVPSVLQVIATDKLGNKTPIQLEIKKDNVGLTSNTPDYLKDLIRSAYEERINIYKDNLIVVEPNTTLNLLEVFEKDITKELKRFNTRDLEFFVNDNTVEKWTATKFEEEGRYDVTVYNSRNSEEFKYTVLVLGKDENVKSIKIKKEATAFSMDKFKGLDTLEVTKVKDSKDAEVKSYFIKYNDQYYTADTEIEFKDKDKVTVEVFKKGQSKGKEVVITRGTAVTTEQPTDLGLVNMSKATSFSDVNMGMWSYNYITQAAQFGLVNGYTDGTFKPLNMITVEEVLAIAGRLAMKQPAKAKPATNNAPVFNPTWGQKEIGEAVKRLSSSMINLDNAGRAATRGEVAYILDSVLKLNSQGNEVYLSDVGGTTYQSSIATLIKSNVINGYKDGTFKPDYPISREELAKMVVVSYQNN